MNTNKEIAIDYMCTNLCTEPHQIVLPEDLHLEHWLAVLRKTGLQVHISAHQVYCRWEKPCHQTVINKTVVFNLNTGQPNSPEDYKRFNDITSV